MGLTLSFIIFMGVTIVKGDFTAPPSSPPNGNVGAPINIENIHQTKKAGLTLNSDSIDAVGLTVNRGLNVLNGNVRGDGFCIGADCRTAWWPDMSTLQNRVTGTCAAGSSIRVIRADGTVACETDNVGATGTTNIYSCPSLGQNCYSYPVYMWRNSCDGQLTTSATCVYGNCGTQTANCTLVGKL